MESSNKNNQPDKKSCKPAKTLRSKNTTNKYKRKQIFTQFIFLYIIHISAITFFPVAAQKIPAFK